MSPPAASPGTLSPAESDPALADRLLEQHRRFLERSRSPWGPYQVKALARQRSNGSLTALLWRGTADRAAGLVWVQDVEAGPRVHGLWLEPSGPETLGALLAVLEGDRKRPVAAVTDVLPGFDPEDQARFFSARGYWHRAKVLMRRDLGAPPVGAASSSKIRPIRPADLRAVVGVYVRAYTARPGEFWTWGAPGAWTEAEHDVMSHRGESGDWAPDFLARASLVWEDQGQVLGAVLVEAGRNGVPYVEDLVVEPPRHRQGIGRALLEASLHELTSERPQAVELAAIRFGAPYRLYRKLGFVEVPPPNGTLDGHWIRGTSPF